MNEPVFFVVTRRPGQPAGDEETGALYFGRIPSELTGKHAKENGFVYSRRLDHDPIGRAWLRIALVSVEALLAIWKRLRDRGELPPSSGGRVA